VGLTRSGSPSLRAMIKDTTDEFYMDSSKEGSSGLPVSRRQTIGAPSSPIATVHRPPRP
jgi:hypothetical protein